MPPDELLEPFALSTTAHVFAFVIGTLFGSFANVCIYRWPAGLSVVRPGSRCGSCETPIAWYDNVPILSYLLLRGRCRHCQAAFAPRYLLVEAATGMLFLAAYHYAVVIGFPTDPLSLRALRFVILAGFLFVLVVITFIDLDHFLILDKVTLPSIVIFYVLGLYLPERTWSQGLIGAAVGYGVPWLIGTLYRVVRGREGMGLGDAKFLAMVGALFGWQGVVASLFLGSLVGTVVSIPLLLFARATEARDTDEAGGETGDTGEAAPGAETDEADDAAPGETGDVAPGDTDHAPSGDTDHATPGDTDRATSGDTDDETSDDELDDEADDDEPVYLGQIEIPFGPFLAIGAIVYAFSESWLHIRFLGM